MHKSNYRRFVHFITLSPKSGMLVPVEAWFQGPLGAKARERILDGPALRYLFRRDYLDAPQGPHARAPTQAWGENLASRHA